VDIVISDFDNTLFKRNHGLIQRCVSALQQLNKPVYIVTYRAEDQKDFILDTLAPTGLEIVGIAFAGSRQKDPLTKRALAEVISKKYYVSLALDDDPEVVVQYKSVGIPAHIWV